jgi:hypothetical protein
MSAPDAVATYSPVTIIVYAATITTPTRAALITCPPRDLPLRIVSDPRDDGTVKS